MHYLAFRTCFEVSFLIYPTHEIMRLQCVVHTMIHNILKGIFLCAVSDNFFALSRLNGQVNDGRKAVIPAERHIPGLN